MENDLIKKIITVTGMEVKAGQFGNMAKLKDEQGLTYTVYEKKRDNTISAAWKNLPKVGDTVQLAFVEEQKEYEGKPYTARTVRVIDSDVANGMANHKAQHTPAVEHQSEMVKGDKFWEQQAYEKCCSLWAAAAIQNNGSASEVITQHISTGAYWKLFQAIKEDGKKRFFDFSASAQSGPLPIIDTETPAQSDFGDIDVSDIPF